MASVAWGQRGEALFGVEPNPPRERGPAGSGLDVPVAGRQQQHPVQPDRGERDHVRADPRPAPGGGERGDGGGTVAVPAGGPAGVSRAGLPAGARRRGRAAAVHRRPASLRTRSRFGPPGGGVRGGRTGGAAGQRPGGFRCRHGRPGDLRGHRRGARLRAGRVGLRRGHGPAAMDLPYRAASGRIRPRHLGSDGGVRGELLGRHGDGRPARHRLRHHRRAEAEFRRGRASRAEPVRQLRGGDRRANGEVPLAFPGDPA